MFSGWPGKWLRPMAETASRLRRQHVVDDRQIVNRQIPHDVHVVLKEPQIDPYGIVVVDIAERPGARQLVDLSHRSRIDEGVIDHQDPPASLRRLHEPFGIVRVGAERLLDQDVLAGLQSRHRQLEMRRDGRRNHDRVDTRIAQQIAVVGRRLDSGIAAANCRQALSTQVADRENLRAWRFDEVPDEVRTPVTAADDADPDRASHSASISGGQSAAAQSS